MVDDSEQPSSSGLREPRAKRFKQDFGQVPSNILEENFEEEDSEEQIRHDQISEQDIEGLRCLSPPASTQDYIYGQNHGETLAEVFETELY